MDMELLRLVLLLPLVPHTLLQVLTVMTHEASCILRAAATNTAGNTGLYSAYGTGTTSCPSTLPSSAAATGITSETKSMDTVTIR